MGRLWLILCCAIMACLVIAVGTWGLLGQGVTEDVEPLLQAINRQPFQTSPSPDGKFSDTALDKRIEEVRTSVQRKVAELDAASASGKQMPPLSQEYAAERTGLEMALKAAVNPTGEAAMRAHQLLAQVYVRGGDALTGVREYSFVMLKGTGVEREKTRMELAQLLARNYKAAEVDDMVRDAEADPAVTDSQRTRLHALAGAARMVPGKAFPYFSLSDVSGHDHALTDYRGQPLLVWAWSSWSPVCRKRIPTMIELYHRYHARGLEMLGLNFDPDPRTLAQLSKDLPWPNVCDGEQWKSRLVQQFGIVDMPTSFLIAPDGSIIGENLAGLALSTAIERVLGTPRTDDATTPNPVSMPRPTLPSP